MSIHCVKLPTANSDTDSDDDSDFDLPPAPVRHQAPKRSELNNPNSSSNPFELSESQETDPNGESGQTDDLVPKSGIDLTKLGLPPLSFDSDPFLTPLSNPIQFIVRRHRIWIGGVKGVKFACNIGEHTVLVAKRKMKYMKKTWFMSRSMNFSLDTPDLTGMLVMQRKGASFSLFSPKERQEDQCHEALAGIKIEKNRTAVICKDLWLKPQEDDVFHDMPTDKVIPLEPVEHSGKISSVKNGAFRFKDQSEPCFISEKQEDESVMVQVSPPLSMTQAFGIVLALFLQ